MVWGLFQPDLISVQIHPSVSAWTAHVRGYSDKITLICSNIDVTLSTSCVQETSKASNCQVCLGDFQPMFSAHVIRMLRKVHCTIWMKDPCLSYPNVINAFWGKVIEQMVAMWLHIFLDDTEYFDAWLSSTGPAWGLKLSWSPLWMTQIQSVTLLVFLRPHNCLQNNQVWYLARWD